jgi:hypothetical protein
MSLGHIPYVLTAAIGFVVKVMRVIAVCLCGEEAKLLPVKDNGGAMCECASGGRDSRLQ